jgi:hypothetical protein
MDFKGFAFDGVEHALAKARGAKPPPCSLHPIVPSDHGYRWSNPTGRTIFPVTNVEGSPP